MAEKVQKESFADKLNASVAKFSKALVALVIILVIAFIALVVISNVNGNLTKKGIEQIDTITYNLTRAADEDTELDESEAAAKKDEDKASKQKEALEQLAALSSKSGIVGVRANMLIADIKYDQKNYSEARDAYLKAANGKKAYTSSLNYFNAAVCSEELGDNDSAVQYYKLAGEDQNFALLDHALFSLGRVYEAKSSFEDAKAAYEKIENLHSSANWAQLAKSRLIALKAEGKI